MFRTLKNKSMMFVLVVLAVLAGVLFLTLGLSTNNKVYADLPDGSDVTYIWTNEDGTQIATETKNLSSTSEEVFATVPTPTAPSGTEYVSYTFSHWAGSDGVNYAPDEIPSFNHYFENDISEVTFTAVFDADYNKELHLEGSLTSNLPTSIVDGEEVIVLEYGTTDVTVVTNYSITRNDGIAALLLIPEYDKTVFTIEAIAVNGELVYGEGATSNSVFGGWPVTITGTETEADTMKILLEALPVSSNIGENFVQIIYSMDTFQTGEYSFGFVTDYSNGADNENRSQAYGVLMEDAVAEFNEVEIVSQDIIVKIIDRTNETYTVTFMVSIDGKEYEEYNVITTAKYNDIIEELYVLEDVSWFRNQYWFTDEARENLATTVPSGGITVYGAYIFDIGNGDVNGDRFITTDDIMLYRQWIVGGYDMSVIEAGEEWDFVSNNTIHSSSRYFLSRVADSNADMSKDIRDITTIRMSLVGGYGYNVSQGIQNLAKVTGQAVVVGKDFKPNEDFVIGSYVGKTINTDGSISQIEDGSWTLKINSDGTFALGLGNGQLLEGSWERREGVEYENSNYITLLAYVDGQDVSWIVYDAEKAGADNYFVVSDTVQLLIEGSYVTFEREDANFGEEELQFTAGRHDAFLAENRTNGYRYDLSDEEIAEEALQYANSYIRLGEDGTATIHFTEEIQYTGTWTPEAINLEIEGETVVINPTEDENSPIYFENGRLAVKIGDLNVLYKRTTWGDEQLSEEGFTYITVNEKVYIVGVPEGSGDLTIPSTLTVEANLENGTETVSAKNFGNNNITKLTTVIPRTTYKTIEVYGLGSGTQTINNINSYSNIYISEDIVTIQSVAFAGSTIESVSIPSSVISVGQNAFSAIQTLKAFEVSSENKTYSTDGRSLLTENGTILLAYANMSGEAYTVPTGIVLIEESAMRGSANLKELTLSSTVKHLGNSAIEDCENLEKIILKGDLQEIYGMENLFLNKDGQKSYLGALLYDGEYFFGITSSEEMEEGRVYYSEGNGETKTGYGYKLSAGNIYIVSVPKYVGGVTSTTLTIPAVLETQTHGTISIYGVLSIDNHEGYKNLVFENGIIDIMSDEFLEIEEIQSVTIPESITQLSVSQVQDGTTVEMTLFMMAMDMKQFIVAEGNPTYKALDDGKILASKDGKIAYVYAAGTGETSISIPEGVERIAGYAIANRQHITEINLPSTLKSVGMLSLGGTRIESIEFQAGFEKFDPMPFYDCTELTEIILNSDLETGLIAQLLTGAESAGKMWLRNGFPITEIREEGVYTFEEIDIFDIAINMAQVVYSNVEYQFRVNPKTYSVDWANRRVTDDLGRTVSLTNNRFIVAGTMYEVDWNEKQVLQNATSVVSTIEKTVFIVNGSQYLIEDDGLYKNAMKGRSINGGFYLFEDGTTCVVGAFGLAGETNRYAGDFGHTIDWENRTVTTNDGRELTTYEGYFDDDADIYSSYYVDWEGRFVYQIQYGDGERSSIGTFPCGGDVYAVDWENRTITDVYGNNVSINSNNLFRINGNYWEVFWDEKKIVDNNDDIVTIVGDGSKGFGIMFILGEAYVISVPTFDGENLTLTIPSRINISGYGEHEIKGILLLANSAGYKNLVISEGIEKIGLGIVESDMELYMEEPLLKDIETISIPSTLTSLHFGQNTMDGMTVELLMTTFVGSSNLKQITVAEGNPKYATNENGTMLLSKDGSVLYLMISNGEKLDTFVVEEGIKKIASMAFPGLNAETIKLPNSLKTLSMYAFEGINYEAIQTLYIPETLGTEMSLFSLVVDGGEVILAVKEGFNLIVTINEEPTEDIFVEDEANIYYYATQVELEVDLDKALVLPTARELPWIKDGKVVTSIKESGTYKIDMSGMGGGSGGSIETVYSGNGSIVLDGVEYVVDLSSKSIYDSEGNLIASNLNDYDDFAIGGTNITIDFYNKTITDEQGNQISTEDRFNDSNGNYRYVNWSTGTVSDWYGNALSEFTINDDRWVIEQNGDMSYSHYVDDYYSRFVINGRNYIINWYSNYIEDYYNGDEYSYNHISIDSNQVKVGAKEYEVRWSEMKILEKSNWTYHDINFNGYAVSYYQGNAYITAIPKYDGTSQTLVVPASVTINGKEVEIYGVAGLQGYEGFTEIVFSEGIVAFGSPFTFGTEPMYMGFETITFPSTLTEVAFKENLEGIELKIFAFVPMGSRKFIVAEGNPALKTNEDGTMLLSKDGKELYQIVSTWEEGSTIVVPDSVESICGYSMLMIMADELVLSKNLKEMSSMVGMVQLGKLTFPQEAPITQIPTYAFMESMIGEIVLSENIKTIAEGGLMVSGVEKITLTGDLQQPYGEFDLGGNVFVVDGTTQAPYLWGRGVYTVGAYDPSKLMEGNRYYTSNGTVNLGGVDYVVDFNAQTIYDSEGNPITLDGNNCFYVGATELTFDWSNRTITDNNGNEINFKYVLDFNGTWLIDFSNRVITDRWSGEVQALTDENKFYASGEELIVDWENKVVTYYDNPQSFSNESLFTFDGVEYQIYWDGQYFYPVNGGQTYYPTDGKIKLGGSQYEVRLNESIVIDRTNGGWSERQIETEGYSVVIFKGKAFLLSVPKYVEGSLTTLTIPNSVYFEGVGNLAIYGVAGIKGYEGYTDLVFSEGIVDIASGLMIADEPMMGLMGIETITIPASMSEVVFSMPADGMLLEGAGIMMVPTLKKIIVAEGNPSVKTNEDGTMLLSKDGKQFLMYATGTQNAKVQIPEGVEKVLTYAFGYAMMVEEIVLPSTITTMGMNSFSMCAIKEIVIPKSVTTIEGGAFMECFNLSKVSFEEGSQITEIGDSVFTNTMLETIILPEGITKIGHGAFRGCSNLKFVSLPSSLMLIGEGAFENCSSLTGIILSDSVEVCKDAFRNCSSLTTLVLDGNNITLNDNAFGNHSYGSHSEVYLTTLVLTKNATSLFKDNDRNLLREQNWAKGITTIYVEERLGQELYLADPMPSSLDDTEHLYGRILWNHTSFNGATKVNNVARDSGVYYGAFSKNIIDVQFYDKDGNPVGEPQTVIRGTSISEPEITVPAGYTLSWSENLAQINSESVYPVFKLNTTGAWTPDGKYQYWSPDGGTTWYISGARESAVENGTLTIPSSLLIGENSDSGYSSTKELTIQIVGIGQEFVEALAIPATCNKVVISEGILTIRQSAFKDQTNITSVKMPESLITIGESAFEGCVGLTSVELPANVSKIEDRVFANSGLTSITIPDTISVIGKNAFADCNQLTEVTINGYVETYGLISSTPVYNENGAQIDTIEVWGPVGAFSNCNNLKVLNIGQNVTEVQEYLFETGNLVNVDTIIVAEGSTLEIELPSPLRNSSGYYGRAEWHKDGEIVTQTSGAGTYVVTLVETRYQTADGWQYQYDGEKWWIVGVPAGSGELTIPATLETTEVFGNIEIYGVKSNSAYGMANVSQYNSIILEDGIERIGSNAFSNCKKLESLTINGNIEGVDALAFNGTNVKTLELGSEVTSLPEELFNEDNLSKITKIIVAEGSSLTESLPSSLTNSNGNNGDAIWNKEGEGVVTEFSGAGTYIVKLKNTTYQTADGWQYQFDGENWWIVGAPEGTGELVIPSELETSEAFGRVDVYGVKSLNDGEGINNILGYESVVVSNGIEAVGEYAFVNDKLTQITIDSNLDSFDATATNSADLTKLVVGNNVTALPEGLIGELLPYVQTVENQAGNVSNSTLPGTILVGSESKEVVWFTIENGELETIKSIVDSAGEYVAVYVDSTYTTNDGWKYKFDGEKWWIVGVPYGSGTITIPNEIPSTEFGTLDIYGIKQEEGSEISNLSRYSSVIISAGIDEIGAGAFSLNRKTTSITLNGNVQTIHSSAFVIKAVTNLTLGSEVTSLPENIFEALSNLTTVTCNSEALIGTALPELSRYGASWIGPEGTSVEQITGVGTYTVSGAVYVVTFLDEDGTELSRQEVEFGRGATPPNPTKEGFRFVGWFTDPGDETTQVEYFGSIREHTTVYAKYIEQKTITIEIIGSGTVGRLNNGETLTVDINSSQKLNVVPTNRHYISSISIGGEKVVVTGLGWASQELVISDITENIKISVEFKPIEAGTLVVPAGSTLPEDYDMTGISKVIVEADMETAFTKTHQGNLIYEIYKDGVKVDSIQEAGEYAIVYPGTTVDSQTTDVYFNNGWQYMSDGTNWWIVGTPTSYSLTIPNMLKTSKHGSIDIYGIKSLDSSYASYSDYVTIEEGIEVIGERALSTDVVTIKGNPIIDENAFNYWLKQIVNKSDSFTMQLPTVINGKTVIWQNEDGIEVTEITAVGTYTIRYSLTVQFVDENGEIKDTQQILYGRDATVPEMEAREGYRFGWFTDPEDKSTQVTDFSNITQNLTVYALYIEQHKVTFIDKDGNQIGETQILDSGEPAVVPEIELEGHTFLGWFKDPSDSSSEVTDFSSIIEDLTVQAVYEIHKFSISTSVEGGSGEFSIYKIANGTQAGNQYTYGSNVSILIKPTGDYGIYKIYVDGEEIEFELRENGTVVYTFNNVTEDHTISAEFAIWIPVAVGNGTYNAQYIGASTTATIPEGQIDGKDWVAIDTEGGRWNTLRIIEVPDSVAEKVNGTTLPGMVNDADNLIWRASRLDASHSTITAAGSYAAIEKDVEQISAEGYGFCYDSKTYNAFCITSAPETIAQDGTPEFVFKNELVLAGTLEEIEIYPSVIKAKAYDLFATNKCIPVGGVSNYKNTGTSVNIIIDGGFTDIQSGAFSNILINNLYINSNVENNGALQNVFARTKINTLTIGLRVNQSADNFLMDLFGAAEATLGGLGVDYGSRRNSEGYIISDIILERQENGKHPYFIITGVGEDEIGWGRMLYGIDEEGYRILYFVIRAWESVEDFFPGAPDATAVIIHGETNEILGAYLHSEINVVPAFNNVYRIEKAGEWPLLIFGSTHSGDSGLYGDLADGYYIDEYKYDGKVYKALYKKKGYYKDPENDYVLWRNAISIKQYEELQSY